MKRAFYTTVQASAKKMMQTTSFSFRTKHIRIKGLWCACAVALLTSCSSSNKTKQEEPTAVKVFRVAEVTADAKREFPFISKPNKSAELSFQVSGKLTTFDAHPGKFYRKGEVIAAVESRDYSVVTMRAKAVYNQAKAEYNRIAALYGKGNLSESSYEKAKADMAIAKAAFETAENQVTDTRLRAPFDGYIQTVSAERYQEVRPMQPIVTFIDMSKLKLEASIPEDVAVASGSIGNVKARFDATPDKEYATTSIEVTKSTMSNNISFLITALLDNPRGKGELLGGMTGTISFELQRPVKSGVLAIPQRALCNRPSKGTYVWVVDANSKAQSVCVTVGKLMSDGMVEVLTGLKGNEAIALTELTSLSEDKQVTIRK
jgi:RND family efflux transporter, MFP subunit